MHFENLPNEILLYLCEFVDVAHLLRSFFGLNARFNALIALQLYSHQLNLRRLSKDHFDLICEEHLPSLLDSVRSLCLSNEETPQLCDQLLARGFTIDRFIHLQSLTLHHIRSVKSLIEITSHCRTLAHITHLFIVDCHIGARQQQRHVLTLFNNIYSIPKLTCCQLNGVELQLTTLSQLLAVSSSIRDLFIENISSDFNGLSHLLTSSTPHLRRLSTTIYSHSVDDSVRHVIPSLTCLKLSFHGCVDSMKNLFVYIPNLQELTIETTGIRVDGHEWKQLFDERLPCLRTFHLKMKMDLMGTDHEVEECIDKLIDSFRTSYWTQQRRWYVQCDWGSSEIITYALFYTLPFAFNTIRYLQEYRTKSTCSVVNADEGKKRQSYEHVQTFENNDRKTIYLHNFNVVCTRFANLRSLDIILPFDTDIYSCDTLLSQLTSLTVRIQISSGYNQLLRLCERAPRLYSLRVIFWRKFISRLFQLTSKSIRRLELGGMTNWNDALSREECVAFCESALGQQCGVVKLDIEDRKSIIDLAERMPNVRLLNVRCGDDRWNQRKLISTENELVRWIENRLPSTCQIMRDAEKPACVQVWIDQQERRTKRHLALSKGGPKVPYVITSIQKLFGKK